MSTQQPKPGDVSAWPSRNSLFGLMDESFRGAFELYLAPTDTELREMLQTYEALLEEMKVPVAVRFQLRCGQIVRYREHTDPRFKRLAELMEESHVTN